MTIAYTGARAAVAQAVADRLGGSWVVSDHPVDRIGDQAVLIATNGNDAHTHCTWRRRFTLGVFVRRHTVAESFDIFDDVTPKIREAIEALTGAIYEKDSPQPGGVIELAGTDYLVELHKVTIETVNA